MQYRLQREAAIIGTRHRQRLTPVVKRASSYLSEQQIKLALVLAFFAAHVPLAILMSRIGYVATLHALITMAGALWLAVSSQKIERVAYAGAYITGAEVLWRMTGAQSFWEVGKYGVAGVFLIAMIRHWRVRPTVLPVIYFGLLLPSAILTLQGASQTESRGLLSGNMSGPLALMIAGCFFSQLALSRENLLRLFLALIGPILGVAVVALFGIATSEELIFTGESNFEASGGFGPNQVSAILGLGTLACFLIILDKGVEFKLKLLCAGVMLFLAVQSALTFSRGGLYNVVGAIILASLFLLKDPRTRIQFLLAILLISATAYFLVLPRLDNFTGGALSARFVQTDMTGREDIVRADLKIWSDNFILGVGPGVAKEHRGELGRAASAHTEFTRLVAEHGVFGLAAMLLLALAAARNLIKARTASEKALIVAVTAWSFLFMLNAAMRIVAPSLMLGLAFANLLPASRKTIVSSTEAAAKNPASRLRRRDFPKALYPQQSRRLS